MQEMWILVTQEDSVYYNKILYVKQEYHEDIILNGDSIWFIYSVNGIKRTDPDWFYDYEFHQLQFILADEKALKLLAFL